MQILVGFLIASAISIAAVWLRMLKRSGAVAATLLGTIVFGLGGWEWSILLVAFFISSSSLTRLFRRQKRDLVDAFSKGGQRDAAQVLANGGVAGVLVLVHVLLVAAGCPQSSMDWAAYAGALAAATADTWATELGVLSHSDPRLITSLRPVVRGTSGGVSVIGTLAGLAGAGLIAALAVLFWPGNALLTISGGSNTVPGLDLSAWRGLGVVIAGLAGSLVDSFLGATVQAIFTCPVCGKETERHPLHTCGTPTQLKRGLPGLSNDLVNAACTTTGAFIGLLVGLI